MDICPICSRLIIKTKDWNNKVVLERCSVHGTDFTPKEKRDKIGKWSGKSKSDNAFNNYQ